MDFEIPEIDLAGYQKRRTELTDEMQKASTSGDYEHVGKLNSELKDIEEVITTYEKLQQNVNQYHENTELENDPEMAQVAVEENQRLQTEIQKSVTKLTSLTQPQFPHDEKNAIIEIRAGTGGTEASLFASEIHRMYLRYLNSIGLASEQLSTSYNDEGGIKETTFEVTGPKAFGKLRFESGVHRVQRVPSTESSGRIHTSAISVVVMPQIETKDVNINDSDLRIDVYRSSGPGGQSVNTTDSAVRITHLPTGITVSCQDGKSQHKNKEKAMSILASKLFALQNEEQEKYVNDIRSQAIQSGDRSAKIRTYNFPQGRITDHRIQQTWHSLSQAMEGEIGEIVETVNAELRKQAGS